MMEDSLWQLLVKLVFLCRNRLNLLMNAAKAAADQILEPNYGHLEVPRPKQDVVPIDIVPEQFPEQPAASQMPQHNTHLDNSHTIEVVMKDIIIRINNGADPLLLSKTFQIIQESIC